MIEYPKIVVVDDDPLDRTMVLRGIASAGQSATTASLEDVFRIGPTHARVLLVLSADMIAPDVLSFLSGLAPLLPRVAVVLIAGDDDGGPAGWLNAGALDVIRRPYRTHEVGVRVRNAARRQALECGWASHREALEAQVAAQTELIRRSREEVSLRLISASRYRDNETGAHIRRIGLYAAVMAEKLGWSAGDVEQIRLAAPMHDIGKVAIPDAVLRKPGGLTAEEWVVMRSHTTAGEEILAGSDVPFLAMGARIARAHHEKWGGGGYPDGLVGQAIPLEARITALVDVYDALRSKRPYKEPWSEPDVLALLRGERGKHFDPSLVDCFFEVLPSIREIWAATPDETIVA